MGSAVTLDLVGVWRLLSWIFTVSPPPHLVVLVFLCLSAHRAFVIAGNSFSGSLPNEVSNWSNMRVLMLFDNHLTSTLPQGIGALTKLSYVRSQQRRACDCTHLYCQVERFLVHPCPGSVAPTESANQWSLSAVHVCARVCACVFVCWSSLLDISSNTRFDIGVQGPVGGFYGTLPSSLGLLTNLRSESDRQTMTRVTDLFPFFVLVARLNQNLSPSLQCSPRARETDCNGVMACVDVVPWDAAENSRSTTTCSLGPWFPSLVHAQPSGKSPMPRHAGHDCPFLELDMQRVNPALPLCDCVSHLSFGYNMLAGSLHPALGNLRQLTSLLLPGNNIVGTVPDALSLLTNLKCVGKHCKARP